jgi:excisionase family DNA binding protein
MTGVLANADTHRFSKLKKTHTTPETTSSSPDYLRSLTEAARYHGISRTLLNELLRRGEIGFVRPGRERRIPDSQVAAWIQRKMVRSAKDGQRGAEI